MKIKYRNDWPILTTRFLLPAIALRGFKSGRRILTFAFWTWRLEIFL